MDSRITRTVFATFTVIMGHYVFYYIYSYEVDCETGLEFPVGLSLAASTPKQKNAQTKLLFGAQRYARYQYV